MRIDVIMLNNSNFDRYGNNVAKLYSEFRGKVAINPNLMRSMINGYYKIWFATDGRGVPMGILVLGVRDLPISSTIDLVYVDSKKRHRGIGDAMLRRAISYSNIKKVSYIDLYRDSKDKFLEELYKKYGFCNEPHSKTSTRMIKSFHRHKLFKEVNI